MKGLLLKDWYMMKQYCRYYLFCAVGFTALSVISSGNMFFVFYPCLLCGMIPVNLIGYDERSRLNIYLKQPVPLYMAVFRNIASIGFSHHIL